MKKYEIDFSKYLSEKNNDIWKWQIVEAENKAEAIAKIVKEHTGRKTLTGGITKVNYILMCEEIEES